MSANDRRLELLDREFIKENLPTLCGRIDLIHSDLKQRLISYSIITEKQLKKITVSISASFILIYFYCTMILKKKSFSYIVAIYFWNVIMQY